MSFSTKSVLLITLSVTVWGCDSYPSAPRSTLRDARASVASLTTSVGVDDGNAKVWRQLVETTALSWTDVARVCPRDGVTPCDGVVGGRDLRGWIWGTADQVTTLLAHYEPAILDSPTVSGFEYFFSAENFFGAFRPTFSFALTYQAGQSAAGWTSSTDSSGAPISASVGNGHNSVSISGSFSVASVADAAGVSASLGVFLWHAAGSGPVIALNDAGSTKRSGGTAIANVLDNDTFASSPAPPSLALLQLSQLSSSDADVALDPSDGSVDVAAGASVGVKRLDYSVCEIAAPTNCDHATATVTIVPYVVDAADDAGSATSTAGGTAIANVLANDRFDGVQATAENVVLSFVSSTNGGVTLDAGDGSVNVAPGTPGGAHAVSYRICEVASPSNCDVATARVNVVPQTILVSSSKLTAMEGGAGSFTVRLSQQPIENTVVSVAFYQGTATVTPTPSTLTFTSDNWSTGAAVTFQVASDADRDNNAATITLSAPNAATVPVVMQITDANQPALSPRASLEAPLNAQTVSGIVDFWGTGTDSNGQVVEARFSVDGGTIYKDRRTGTTFRVSGGWNTRTVANGWHTVELRVIDNSGNDGRMSIKVFVSN